MSYYLCACRFEIITCTFMNTSGNIPRQTRVEMDERGWLRSNSENSVYHLKLRYTNAYDFIMTKSCMWYNYDKTFCFCYSIHSWSTEFKWLFFFGISWRLKCVVNWSRQHKSSPTQNAKVLIRKCEFKWNWIRFIFEQFKSGL